MDKEIDFEALGLYMRLNCIPAPWTIFKNIQKLMPGQFLVYEKGKVEKHKYWKLENTDREVNKSGDFEVPISAWIKKERKPYVDRYLSGKQFHRQGIFNPEVVQNLVDLHLSGKQEWGWQLWNLIVFSHWHERYFSSS